ncbi:hypothetical protein SEA_CECE_316 [Microbacterium phage Cece]|nr:hypothetical protein SEA_CECE_14 [Microbacterium phage Cece]UVG35322.1 hypothetical protein SEA_CECE_316 [Microbacterium phage Cece]
MSIETKIRKVDHAREALRAAQEAYDAAVREREAAQRVRAEEPAPGSKVYVTVKFPGENDKVYEYFAIRTENPRPQGANWYVTGRAGKVSWESFISSIERGDYNIFPFLIN